MDKDLQSLLEEHKQGHLVTLYERLNNKDKEKFLDQIREIDFDLMNKLYLQTQEEVDLGEVEIEPVDYVDKYSIAKKTKEDYCNLGERAVKNNELAVVTMAGGQGTRLGHKGPKGTYVLVDNKSLFELLCDHLKKAYDKYGTYVNWYIMTSEENDAETKRFFEDKNYFSYPKEYIHFFKQGTLPMLDEQGRIIVGEDGLIKQASDGHGGTLSTLKNTGILDEMKQKGFKWIFISGVDNVLANLVDPLLLGLAISDKADIAVKSVEKTNPEEKVGVFCKKNGKIGVIEYTEISKELASMRDDSGSLVYGDLNALLHVFSLDVLEKICSEKLPYHVAHKKCDYMKEDGQMEIAEEPNSYKFEMFIFDAFEMTDNVSVIRVKREEEFAPLKNAKGVDSPETARAMYNNLNKNEAKSEGQKQGGVMETYKQWMNPDVFDKKTIDELKAIENNEEEIRDRFYKELDFGTAGLRGVMGAGTNRMNKYTVTKATQGLANYIIKKGLQDKGVTIFYDTRNRSKEFATETALCLNANGIKTYIFDGARPLPMLSYSIRVLKTAAGVMITASHNPPEYNGYKLLWGDGVQIVNPVDKEIIKEVRDITDYNTIKTMDIEDAKKQKLFRVVGEELERRYLREILSRSLNGEEIKKQKEEIVAVYSPIHGTGLVPIQKVLEKEGYKNIYIVPEQELPNGNFPTVAYPNPEGDALEYAINLGKEVGAELCFATDPDCDRVGLVVLDENGEYQPLNGNEIAVLMLEYVLSQLKKKKMLPKNGVVISSIVSTNLAIRIAEEYGVDHIGTLTGFKYIGEQMRKLEESGEKEFVFGFEQSNGYLFGDHARDKDGVGSIALLMELACYYKKQGLTILQQLAKIHKKYGMYTEHDIAMTMKGESGEKAIAQIMDHVRNNIPTEIAGKKVLRSIDYGLEKVVDMKTGKIEKTTLPNSNVIYFELEDDHWIAIRPSGTEPKIRFYMGLKTKDKKEAENTIAEIQKFIDQCAEVVES